MLKRNMTALLLAGTLTLGVCGASGYASQAGGANPTADPAATPLPPLVVAVEQTTTTPAPVDTPSQTPAQAPPSPDPAGSVSFEHLNARLREGNLNMLSLAQTIASIQALDYEDMQEDLREVLNQLADQQWSMQGMSSALPGLTPGEKLAIAMSASSASRSLQQSYDGLRGTFDDLKSGKLQADNAGIVRQLRSAQDQIAMAGETLYIAITELQATREGLERSLGALDRTIQELELRYELGQISALTLQQTKGGRTSVVSACQTLDMNITNCKLQLELLLGAPLSGTIALQPLPQLEGGALAAMALEGDLAKAKENSYPLYAAQKTLDQAKTDFKDAARKHGYDEAKYQYISAQHTAQAAQYTYDATVQGFELSFRTLYQQVHDYEQVLQAAKTALACEEETYRAMQLKREQGTLSQNKLLDAADTVATAKDQVAAAQRDLFSAYRNYRWAVDHGILN